MTRGRRRRKGWRKSANAEPEDDGLALYEAFLAGLPKAGTMRAVEQKIHRGEELNENDTAVISQSLTVFKCTLYFAERKSDLGTIRKLYPIIAAILKALAKEAAIHNHTTPAAD